ncbi:MAG: YiiD C-terminal domain-containing protein, partial [Planctomycetota bacterium]
CSLSRLCRSGNTYVDFKLTTDEPLISLTPRMRQVSDVARDMEASMEIQDLPFNRWLGLQVDGDRISLEPQEQHLNHVGTVHATVIFGVAEAATGSFLLKRFPELPNAYVALLRESNIKYRRPSALGSTILAQGSLSDEDASRFLATLESRGRATVEIAVTVTQSDTEVFAGTFKWFATTK